MPDNFIANPGVGGDTFAADDVAGIKYPYSKLDIGGDGASSPVTAVNPLPVSGVVAVSNFPATQPVSVAALPLPAGAATEATLSALSGKTPALGSALSAASQPVVIASDQAAITTKTADIPATTGNLIALNGAVTLALDSADMAIAGVSGTYSQTFAFEGSDDNQTTWFGVPAVQTDAGTLANGTSGALVSTVRRWVVEAIGCTHVRVRCSAFTSGTAAVRLSGSRRPLPIRSVVQNTVAVSGTVTSNIGTGALAAGTNAIGDVGLQVRANATGTATIAKVFSAASTNATVVKASAGRIVGYQLANTTAAAKFVKFFNKATAPVPGTDVPVFTAVIPANGISVVSHLIGLGFATGIGYSITNLVADLDVTAVAAADVVGHIAFA
jgi:hypothetical protein